MRRRVLCTPVMPIHVTKSVSRSVSMPAMFRQASSLVIAKVAPAAKAVAN